MKTRADLKKPKRASRKARRPITAYCNYIYRINKASPAVKDTVLVPGWLRAELCTRIGTEAARLAKLNRRGTITQREMRFMLLFSRQGKLRLQKWYVPLSDKEKKKITRELVQTVLARKPKMCSFLEWRDLKIVYKRSDNELITLEIIHRYVELLDKYFGSVCELDIIFNFEKAYFILDEFLLGGEAQETSKKNVLKAIEQADLLQEEAETPRSVLEEIGLT
ncbi:AP-1 complex subunit sigma-2 [Bagarius yarrelli]|uniref:AP-1 complex subunit sigma-2 n=1 Tax=Bagarius yarrelli TaxID=175774 RepID=A0A556U099_BAGYA|nr:AP-1 complex subunit sigma-2 [Bagarius yarrelli]